MLQMNVPLLDPSMFRAYDIRGIVGSTLTEENVFLIGKAIGSLARELGDTQVVVARDGRLSGPMLARSLNEGLLSSGCDVINLGMVPTPLLYFATHLLEQRSGVMVTGSHNPPNYNGLKIVMRGGTLTAAEIKSLYNRIEAQQFTQGRGTRYEMPIVDRYIQTVAENIKLARPLKVVVDAGNGVAGMIAPALFTALGCDVHALY